MNRQAACHRTRCAECERTSCTRDLVVLVAWRPGGQAVVRQELRNHQAQTARVSHAHHQHQRLWLLPSPPRWAALHAALCSGQCFFWHSRLWGQGCALGGCE